MPEPVIAPVTTTPPSTTTPPTSTTTPPNTPGSTTGGNPTPPTGTVLGSDPKAVTLPDGFDWRGTLPPELKDNPALKNFKSIADLAKSHVEVQKFVGAPDKVIVPKADAPAEEKAAFFNKLGRPEKADGYKMPEIAAPAGTSPEELTKVTTRFLGKFHELGLTQDQASALYKDYMEYSGGQVNDVTTKRAMDVQKGMETLKTEWGGDFDKKINLAKVAVKEFGGQPLVDWMNTTGLGDDTNFMRLFANIGAKLMEDRADGMVSNTGLGGTPETARAQINALYVDKDFMEAYNTRGHAGHKAALEKMTNLQKVAAGHK